MRPAHAASPHRSLARRYARLVGAVTILLLLVSSAVQLVFSLREAREQAGRLQRVQAQAAAREIEQYLALIERGLRDASKLPASQAGASVAALREELHRLMVVFPAVSELRVLDSAGGVRLLVSRSALDRVGPEAAAIDPEPALLAPGWRATFYRDDTEPWARLSLPMAGGQQAVATVNLRFLADVVSGLRVGDAGQVYVVDAANRLIAHPQASQVLRRPELSGFAPVQAARQALAASRPVVPAAVDAVGLDGQAVIATATGVAGTGWLVVAVLPRAEVLAPALATLARTVMLVALGGALALVVSVLFARRMAAPIVALRAATRRIASGDLATPIQLASGDEIEQLADDFNRMARELQASYAGLEAKVADRTAALSDARDRLQAQATEVAALNAQLLQQMTALAERQRQAEQASAAKTRFLAAASHDLRQPMHSIGLLVSLLRHQLVDPQGQSLADKVQQSVAVMEELFSSLLDISKLDAGAVQAEPQPLAIGALLAQVGQTYAPQAAARGLRLRVVPSRCTVRSDPVLLARMLGNLVANAVRYTARGGVVIGCRRRGAQLAVQVIDSGPGIAPAQQALVFEEFVRLPQAGAAASQGLGLGLSIVQRSAAVLGHGLALRSLPGRGACFELLLPIVADSPAGAAAAAALPAAARARLMGAFVLVIDDDTGNREATAALCRQWGCLTLAAPDLAAALAGLAQHLRAPDLLITDQRLADGPDGFAALQAVRDHSGEAIPALLVTADLGAGQAARARSLGAWLLHKPAGADALLRAAVQALEGGGAAALLAG